MSDQQISNTTPIPFSDNQEQQKQQFSNNGSLSTASSGFLQLGDKDRPTRVSFHNLVAAPTPAPAPEVRRTAITLNTAPTVATLKAQESAIESQRQKQDEVTSAFVTSPIPAYATSDRQASDAEIIASDKPQQQQGERPSSVALTDQRMFSDEEDDHEEEELKNEQVAHQSQASLTSNNVITARIMKAIEKNISDYLDSPFMTNVYIFSEKIKVRVVFWLLVNYVLIGAAIVISYKLTNVTVPGMWVYNLLHVLLSLLTLLVVQTVEVFSYEVSTAILGSQLIHGKAVLSELTKNSIYRDPAAGRKIRYFLWFLSLGFEGVVTWLCVQLEWTPEPSTLGIQPCTPATYPTAPALLPDFGNYIQGDMEFALIYNYALPLADGVIGGWASWPLWAPSSAFSVSNQGIVYAIEVSCNQYQVSNTSLNGTMLQFRNVVEYPGTYTAVIDVIYPAGSWSIDGINVGQTDIIQLCPIKIICGPGNLTFHFVVDEWFMVTGGQMTQISAGGFTASQRMDQPLYFGQLDSGIKMSDKVMWGNMTTWISSAIESAMNGTVYYSTQGAKFCNMMRWGTLPDGFYYPNITSNALSAALSSMAHYVVLQYNGSATTDCEYYGIQNAGKISADNTTVIVCLAVGIVLAISLLYNMLGLFLNNTTDWTASKACRPLRNPLRFMYDFKTEAREMLPDVTLCDVLNRKIYQKYDDVLLSYGESKKTRSQPIGHLQLGEKRKIVRMIKDREYH